MALKVLQWNARSANSNRESLQRELITNQPDIVLLCETWFKAEQRVHFQNYFTVRKDRPDGWGGVAILVKTALPFKTTLLHTNNANIEVVAVLIQSAHKSFTVVSLYRVIQKCM